MTSFTSLAVLVASGMLLACTGEHAQLQRFRDDVCACTTTECVQAVERRDPDARMLAWKHEDDEVARAIARCDDDVARLEAEARGAAFVDTLARITRVYCGCTDAPCMDAVDKEVESAHQAYEEERKRHAVQMSTADLKREVAVTTELVECMKRFAAKEQP